MSNGRSGHSYDYVVVGAGSAGCVLANRLTQDPNRTVLLLEAGGPDDRVEIHIPIAFSRLFRSELDWAFETEPQPQLGDRRLYWPRGKVLGGSSSINAQIYIRGHRSVYDGWARLGNPGWSYAEVLPYFLRAEHQERGASAFHGVGGPLHVSDLRTLNPMSEAFLNACTELGLPGNADFNGAEQEGFGRFQVTQKDAQRCSAATAYLHPAMSRPNLTVVTAADVTRVLIERQRAVGVQYLWEGALHEARSNAEVILSAGAVKSPQLLMLSGIGPAEHLAAVGVAVVHDLPGVGQNLQDHPILSVTYHSLQPISLTNAESIEAIEEYTSNGSGPLTSNGGEVGGFVRTSPALEAPDLQFHFNAAWYLDHGMTNPEGHGFTFGPTTLQPKSRGTITLRSSDPLAPPRIQPRYYDEPSDMQPMVEGVHLARELAHTRAFAALAGPEHTPGAAVRTDAEIRAFVRERTETVYHPCGTCAMGVDHLAVVDPELRVRGIEGLRVVDASIMPRIINGALNAPTIMIAEQAADLISRGAARAAVPMAVGSTPGGTA